MAGQEQHRSQKRDDEPDNETSTTSAPAAQTSEADLDDILADIDDALETNAETFVKQFQQKGGQ